MSRLRQGLRRRSAALVKNPRHFAQLLLPMILALCGWLALALEWWRVGIILISAALLAFATLIWFRLRRMQTRIDRGVRLAANRLDAMILSPVESGTLEQTGDRNDTRDTAESKDESESPAPPWEMVLMTSAVAAGLPTGLFHVLDAAPHTTGEEALLVVPSAQSRAVTNWVEGVAPERWSVVDEESGLLRPRAAGTRALIILDSEDHPTYRGVLDQSFFWWLPRSACVYLVSRNVAAFASRLSSEHQVGLALTQHGYGSAQAAVTRKKDDLYA